MSRWVIALFWGCTAAVKDTAELSASTDTGGSETGSPLDDPLAGIDPSLLAAGPSPCREPAYVVVEEVIDGDTIRVTSGRGVERVRLIGIDAPEVDHDGDWDECWAEEARAYLTALIEGASVWMTFDAECEDDYDRTLSYVHARPGDQGFVQRSLLGEGWVTTFAVSPNTAFESQFSQDEASARAADAGLWGACGR